MINSIRHGVTKAASHNAAIFNGMAWLSLFVLLSKLMAAAREMAIAYRFGTAPEVEAYLFVFNSVSWPLGVWFGVLTVALVPLVMKDRTVPSLRQFWAELLGTTLLIAFFFAAVTWLGLPLLIRCTSLSPAIKALALNSVPVFVLVAPLGVLISLLSAWLMATGRKVNTVLEGVAPLVIAIFALCSSATSGTASLAWGTVAGFAMQLAILGWICFSQQCRKLPILAWRSPHWDVFWRGFSVMLIGQALMSTTIMIDQFYAVGANSGDFARLSYANRILTLLLTCGTIVSRATLPVFSALPGNSAGDLRRISTRWAGAMFTGGAIISIITFVAAPIVVPLLFERGAFGSADSFKVAHILKYGAAQIPFYFASLVLVSALLSQGHHKWVAFGAGLNLIVKAIANALFVPFLGVEGVALATGVMYAASLLFTQALCARVASAGHFQGNRIQDA